MSNPLRRSHRAKSIKSGETVPKSLSPSQSFDWRKFLIVNPATTAVPAWCFTHVALARELREVMQNSDLIIQVELEEDDYPDDPCVQGKVGFWVASVKTYFGLMAFIQYDYAEGDENDMKLSMRYVNFMTDAKSTGYTLYHKKTTVACCPKSFRWLWDHRPPGATMISTYIVNAYLHKWMDRSIPNMLTTKGDLNGKYESDYTVGQRVEALDKSNISQMRVAKVVKLVGGRVHLRYWDSNAKPGEADFVCHELSSSVFPLGWSRKVGQALSAPRRFRSPTLRDDRMQTFLHYDQMPRRNMSRGMWLEIVDPLNPSVIAAAQITEVLEYGYVLVTIKRRQFSTTKCFHLTSPQLLYCGFCEKFGLQFEKPSSYKGNPIEFCWKSFLKETKGVGLIATEFHEEDEANHGIVKDMKLEAVDLMEPSHVCVATVSEVKGTLLRVSFDGWPEPFDQWMVSTSMDIFPIGWCEANGYPLRYR